MNQAPSRRLEPPPPDARGLRTGGGTRLRAAGWAAAALAAHAAWLDLLQPGAWAFGVRPAGEVLRGHLPALAALLAIGVVAGVALAADARALVRRAGAPAVAAFLGAWTVVGALLARTPGAYAWSLALTGVAHVVALATLVLLLQALPLPDAATIARWRRVLPWGAAAFATAASAAFGWLVFHHLPHVPDSVAYLFQARTYAIGLPYRPAPPEPELFRQFLVAIRGGKWFSVFPPGWPLVLALGVRAGAPWLVNPVLAGVGVLAAHALVRRLHSRGAADLVAIVVACSPTYLVAGASYMAHTLSIVCALLALLGAEKASAEGRASWAAGGGAALGLLFLTRPVEGAILGLVLAARSLGIGGRRLPWRGIAAAAIGTVVVSSAFFANNRVLTGDPLRDPVQQYFDETFYPGSNTLGFGPTKGNFGWGTDLMPGHSPVEAAVHLNMNLDLMDIELFGWAFGSLLLVVIFGALALRGPDGARAARFGDTLLFRYANPWLAVCGLSVLSMALYWYSGADMGPRYLLQCLVPFAVLSVAGARAAAGLLGADRRRVALMVVLASVLGAAQVLPWRAANKYRDYRGIRPDVAGLRDRFGKDALVLVRGSANTFVFNEYGGAFLWNAPHLAQGTVFARAGTPEQNARLQAAFPGRRVWEVEAPNAAHEDYRVLTGR